MLLEITPEISVEPKSIAGIAVLPVGPPEVSTTSADLFYLKVILKSGAHFKCESTTREKARDMFNKAWVAINACLDDK